MYKEETSIVAKMISDGRGVGLDWILLRKWLVSWTWEGRDLTKGWRWASMYAEICLVEESKEETMGQPGLLVLSILCRRYREEVWGWKLSKELSVSDKPWEGPAVETRWWWSWL